MFKNKLVAVLNKKIEPGVAMNALAHMSIGFGGNIGSEALELMDYVDGDGMEYPNISKMPFIILKTKNSNKVRDLLLQAKEKGVKFSVFTNTMTVGTWEQQESLTKETKQDQMEYYGIVLLGPHEIVTEMTKKLSLWS